MHLVTEAMALEGILENITKSHVLSMPLENLHFKVYLALTLHPFVSTRTRTPKREHAKWRGGDEVEVSGKTKLSLNAPKTVLHFSF